jgi:hypothetical protein
MQVALTIETILRVIDRHPKIKLRLVGEEMTVEG